MSKFFTLENFQYVYGKIKEIYATQEALDETQSQLSEAKDQLTTTQSDLLAIQEGIGVVETELGSIKESAVTQDDLNAAIAEAGAVTFVFVDELPATGTAGIIYLLKNEEVEGEPTSYSQYLYQNGEWAETGQAKIDLSNFITKTEVEFVTQEEIDEIINPTEEEPTE